MENRVWSIEVPPGETGQQQLGCEGLSADMGEDWHGCDPTLRSLSERKQTLGSELGQTLNYLLG